MSFRELCSALFGLNGCGLSLALRRSPNFRAYLSDALRRYDEFAGHGLSGKDPIQHLTKDTGVQVGPDDRVQLPPRVTGGGGTSLAELTILAATTQLLQPEKVFEIGTFNGRTTAVFLMNTPENATVLSLDLPPTPSPRGQLIDSDEYLIGERKLASYVYEHRLEHRFQQLLGDSMDFDPSPYSASIELGFIDGAHTYEYVKNDTEKMALMMAEKGLVFWHDYGGKGRFRPLTEYLESLSKLFNIYRVLGTTLAWTTAAELRKLR